MADVIVNLVQREDGRCVASAIASPYFCFEADNEDAVKQKVESAIAFYEEAKRSARARTSGTRQPAG